MDKDVESAGMNRNRVLAAVCLAGLMMPLSFTGPAIALTAIMRELGGTPAGLAWVVNAFVLSFGGFVMAAGSLADQFGRKRIFALGILLFTVLSIVIGFAPNVLTLNLLRGAQGVAAAMAMAAGSAALAQEFDGAARTRAYSLLGTSFGVGLAFGPVWAGLMVDSLGWRWIFFTGTVIGLLVLVFGLPHMRETRDPQARGIDYHGTISFTATLLLLTFAIVQAPQWGWADGGTVGLLLAAAATLAVFVLVETRQARPMLDLSLFRYMRFIGVQSLPIATAFSFVVPLVMLPVRFVGIDGFSAVQAGAVMIALSAPMMIVPFLAALATRWVSAGTLSGAGLVIAATGLYWFSSIEPGTAAAPLIGPMLLIGAGTGVPWGLMDSLAVSVVPVNRAGMATGIFSTMRVAGEAIAIAATGAVLSLLIQGQLPGRTGTSDVAGMKAANLLATGNLQRAADALPGLGRTTLAQLYAEAFSATLQTLAWITIAAAAVALVLLRQPRPSREAPGEPTALEACRVTR